MVLSTNKHHDTDDTNSCLKTSRPDTAPESSRWQRVKERKVPVDYSPTFGAWKIRAGNDGITGDGQRRQLQGTADGRNTTWDGAKTLKNNGINYQSTHARFLLSTGSQNFSLLVVDTASKVRSKSTY